MAQQAHPHPGDGVAAMLAYMQSDAHSLKDRNLAVWALGQARDSRALPDLESDYTGNDMVAQGAFASAVQLTALGLILLVSGPVAARRSPCPGPEVVGLWHMNENEGSVIKDATENHHDGETYGTSWVSGMLGSGLYFDGEAYVDLGDDDDLNALQDFSIEAWIFPPARNMSAFLMKFSSRPGCCLRTRSWITTPGRAGTVVMGSDYIQVQSGN